MSSFPEETLLAFRDELTKHADMMGSVGKVLSSNQFRNAGAMAGTGLLAGGTLGTAVGAVKGYRDARQEGGTVGQSLLSGAAGGAKGLARGAAIGAATGAVGGGLMKGDVASRLSGMGGVPGAFSRFGERQLHGFTGHLSPQQLEGVRGGAYAANTARDAAVKAMDHAPLKDVASAKKEFDRASAVAGVAQKTQDAGLTSIPGIARGLRKDFGGTIKQVGQHQWSGTSLAEKALMVGVPAAGLAHTVATREAPEGAGKGESMGSQVGSLAGGVLGAPLPLAAQEALSRAGDKAGRTVGKGVDYLRGRRKPAYSATEIPNVQENQHTPIEHVTSPAAAGKPGMGM